MTKAARWLNLAAFVNAYGGGEPKNSHLSIYVIARIRGEERN
jgi:hypothetical protein